MSYELAGVDPSYLTGADRELFYKWRVGDAVILPDDLTRLQEATAKERARRAEVEEVCKLARELIVADMHNVGATVDRKIYVSYIFSIAEAYVAERKKREDWK